MNFYLLGFMEVIFFIYGASMVFYVVKRRTHDLKTVYRFTKVAFVFTCTVCQLIL